MLAARQDDFEAAHEAIREAEQLGCSPGQLRMLRGQVALYQGQIKEAIEHLDEAVKLVPDSVAAWSMLAVAHNSAGTHNDFHRALAEAERLLAVTPEDFLFRGHAEAALDPERALQTLDEAVRRRPSVLARLVRVQTLKMNLMDAPRPEQAELAMDDVRLIKRQLPDNPMVLTASLEVHSACFNLFDEFKMEARRQAALDEAWKDARALERFPDLPNAVVCRWVFLDQIGRQEVAWDDLQRLAEKIKDPLSVYFYGLALGRRGKSEQAVNVLAQAKGAAVPDLVRGSLLAELPDGARRAGELYAQIAAQNPAGWELFNSQLLLRFLGRKQEAIDVSQQFLQQPERFPPVRRDSFRQTLEYCAGKRSANELLDSLRPSRVDLVNAHLCIALTALADADRAEAKKHFQASRETRVWEFLPYDLSTLFLARMEQDPAWPPWIPVK